MGDTELKRSIEKAVDADGRPAVVESLERMAGGASRKIYELGLRSDCDSGVRRYVVRMDSDPGRISGSGVDEFELLRAVAESGVTVPRVHWRGEFVEDGVPRSYVVMDRIEGEAIARRLHREDDYATTRRALPKRLAAELARIHSVDLDQPRLASLDARGRDSGIGGFAVSEIRRYRELLAAAAAGHPWPVLAFAGRWLANNIPPSNRTALVHGDFRVGNVMFDRSGLTAVLDWELAHVGDPVEDLGWFCVRAWRFGVDDLEAGGLCSREEFFAHYERESGISLDRRATAYWEIFGNWKWAIICVLQGASYRASGTPDVELAAIGRRVAETEREILALMDGVERTGART